MTSVTDVTECRTHNIGFTFIITHYNYSPIARPSTPPLPYSPSFSVVDAAVRLGVLLVLVVIIFSFLYSGGHTNRCILFLLQRPR